VVPAAWPRASRNGEVGTRGTDKVRHPGSTIFVGSVAQVGETVLGKPVTERSERQPEKLRSPGLHSPCFPERGEQEPALDLVEVTLDREVGAELGLPWLDRSLRFSAQRRRKGARPELGALGECRRALDHVLELTDVAGERILLQELLRLLGEMQTSPPELLRE